MHRIVLYHILLSIPLSCQPHHHSHCHSTVLYYTIHLSSTPLLSSYPIASYPLSRVTQAVGTGRFGSVKLFKGMNNTTHPNTIHPNLTRAEPIEWSQRQMLHRDLRLKERMSVRYGTVGLEMVLETEKGRGRDMTRERERWMRNREETGRGDEKLLTRPSCKVMIIACWMTSQATREHAG